MKQLATGDFVISSEVKVWNSDLLKAMEIGKGKKPTARKKYGPYADLSKSQSQALSQKLMKEIENVVDWNKPDSVMEVLPKWAPDIQYVKPTGK